MLRIDLLMHPAKTTLVAKWFVILGLWNSKDTPKGSRALVLDHANAVAITEEPEV